MRTIITPAESIGHQICIHLLRNHFDLKFAGTPPTGKLGHLKMRRVREFIEEHLGDNLSLVSLANVAGVSASYFSRLFRNSLGVAPHQYLLKRRLDHARVMLRSDRHSIAEIASTTGFSDQSHLTRHFKRRFGVTPQECRRNDGRFVSGSPQYSLASNPGTSQPRNQVGGAAG